MKKVFLNLVILTLAMFLLMGCGASTVVVTFESNGGSEIEAISVNNGEGISVLPTPIKEGYDFKGWFIDNEYKDTFSSDVIEESITVYAKWDLKVYTVTFDTGITTASVEVKHGETAVCPITPVKPGYEFKNWDKALTNITSSQTITAVYDTLVYEVKFMVDGVQYGEIQKINYGNDAVAPTDPTKTGYTFSTWDAALTNVRADLVCNAVFTINKYTVGFYSDNVLIGSTQEVEYGAGATAPTAPKKTGYTFIAWDVDFSEVKGALTVNAIYEPVVYDVVFKVDGVQYGEGQLIEHGKAAQKPATDPTKEYYKFTGWDVDFSNITGDLVINAIFVRESYVVKFMVDGVQYGESQVIKVNESATTPTNPTKDYYTFKSWDKEFTNVNSDLEINAVFEADVYNIKYYNGTTEITDLTLKTYKACENTDLPVYAKSEEKYFVGWHIESDLSDDVISTITKGTTGEISLYAAYVALDFNGGALSWEFNGFNTTNTAAKGINPVSNLPEIFEQDFYKYLKENNLLSSLTWKAGEAATWTAFSGVNPNHSGDPYKIWNDTETNLSGGTPGYAGSYLWTTATCNDDGSLIDIEGGFLGTEPYKTKYINLTSHLALMLHQRYTDSLISENTNSVRALIGFIIDGYFYGTQGLTGSTVAAGFKPLREVVPTTTTLYSLNTTTSTVSALNTIYKATVCGDGFDQNLLLPMREGYYLAGWATTADGAVITSGANVGSSITTLYAIWEPVA